MAQSIPLVEFGLDPLIDLNFLLLSSNQQRSCRLPAESALLKTTADSCPSSFAKEERAGRNPGLSLTTDDPRDSEKRALRRVYRISFALDTATSQQQVMRYKVKEFGKKKGGIWARPVRAPAKW